MPYITVGYENSTEIKLYYNDINTGDPIIFIHGFPFSGVAWEKQFSYFHDKKYRLISYDRRGFGESSKPGIGYDWDTFADDLNQLITGLDLNNVTLVGHSMGTGEITRYLSKYGSDKILRAVLISPIPPYLLKSEDNAEGLEKKIFDEFKESINKDKYSYLADFLEDFYGIGKMTKTSPISSEKLSADFQVASKASQIAMYHCIDTWIEDFRWDLKGFDDVSTLIIHGDADKILPINLTANKLAPIIDARLRVINGGSHGIPWTHAEEICLVIENFITETNKSFERDSILLEYPAVH